MASDLRERSRTVLEYFMRLVWREGELHESVPPLDNVCLVEFPVEANWRFVREREMLGLLGETFSDVLRRFPGDPPNLTALARESQREAQRRSAEGQ
jgi:hypothetical protein